MIGLLLNCLKILESRLSAAGYGLSLLLDEMELRQHFLLPGGIVCFSGR